MQKRKCSLQFADSKIADEDTQIIIEATLDREFSEDELACFDVVRVKEYKTNKHIFLQKAVGRHKSVWERQ